jgi:recombination protein RecA
MAKSKIDIKKIKNIKNKDNGYETLLKDILVSMDNAQLLGGDDLVRKVRGVLSTQSPGLDVAIGRGGIPLGRLSIIAGADGTGKTTLALHVAAECQKMGGIVIYIDLEYKLDPDYARAIGIDTEHFIISYPPYLEAVFEKGEKLIEIAKRYREETKARVPILIILDSMNSAITKEQTEANYEDKHYSPQARVFSNCLPKFMRKISEEDVALLFIAQYRKKIGVIFGDDFSMIGGFAPKHNASLIMMINRVGFDKDKNDKVGNRVKIECVKNQIAPPFKKTECLIEYGKGFNREYSLLWHAENCGIIEKKSNYYIFESEKIGYGTKKTIKVLKSNKELYKKILKKLNKKELVGN